MEECCLIKLYKKNRRYLVILGGILVNLTIGTVYTFGNMSRYMVSYIRIKLDPTLTYEDSIWIFSASTLFHGLFLFIGGILLRKIGSRKTALLGSIICSSGVWLTYFTIKHSFILTALTYGAMFGVGAGICYAAPMSCAMKWLPDNKGLVNGLVIAGIGGGAFIFDPIQTAYLNPENEIPDQQGFGNDKYFSQSDILDRVPSCFLMLGFCYTGIQLIGSLLLCDPPNRIDKDLYLTIEPNPTTNEQEHHKSPKYDTIICTETSRIPPETKNGCMESNKCTDSAKVEEIFSEEKNVNKTDYTPNEVLKSKFIYILWFIALFDGPVSNFISTLYKAYGQTFIKDDHFLAVVGSLAAACIGGGRIMWGMLSDRYSVRTCLIISSGLMCILMLTFNVTSLVGGKELYLVYVCLFFISLGGNCVLLATATAKTYGTEYYGENFGIVFTAIIISSPISAVLTSTLKIRIGWDGMFYMISGFSFINMVLSWLFKVDRIS